MEEMLLSPLDMALILQELNLRERESSSLIKTVWENEKAFILSEYHRDFRKWLRDVNYWNGYLYDKDSMDAEFLAVQRDLSAQGYDIYEEDYTADDFDIDLFFKSMRIRLLYMNNRGYERMKLRTMLSEYGYQRRTPGLKRYIRDCLLFYHIQPYLRDYVPCSIEDVDLDDMLIFRVINGIPLIKDQDADEEHTAIDGVNTNPEMKEINTKPYAEAFCDMAQKLMNQGTFLGNYIWGDGGGYTMTLPTYELVSCGHIVWCALVEFVHSSTGVPNRSGIIATFPSDPSYNLNQTASILIPYAYSKRFNTLAFHSGTKYEIRSYGKITVGRARLKQDEFFDYVNKRDRNLIFFDREGHPYIKAYEYDEKFTLEEFSRQTYEFTKLIFEAKDAFRDKKLGAGDEKTYEKHIDSREYSVDDNVVTGFADHFRDIGNFEMELLGNKIGCIKGIHSSINNQGGYLRDENYFGRNLEFTLQIRGKAYPIAFQLYYNTNNHYRVFLFGKNKMLTSVNLTTGQESDTIRLGIQIKVTSPRHLSASEKAAMRDNILQEVRKCGITVDHSNTAILGRYIIPESRFLGSTPKQFIQQMLAVGICKNKQAFGL